MCVCGVGGMRVLGCVYVVGGVRVCVCVCGCDKVSGSSMCEAV